MNDDGSAGALRAFATGDHTALIGEATAALVEASAETGFVDGLWERVRAGATFGELTEFLVAHGLSALPSFAVMMIEQAAGVPAGRVLARGSIGALLMRVDGTREPIDPGDAITWVERSVSDPAVVWLGPLPVPDVPSMVSPFELSIGRVPASWVTMACAAVDQVAGHPPEELPAPSGSGPPGAAEQPDSAEGRSDLSALAPPPLPPRPPGLGPPGDPASDLPPPAPAGLAQPYLEPPVEGEPDEAAPRPTNTVPPPPEPSGEPAGAVPLVGSGETVRYDPDPFGTSGDEGADEPVPRSPVDDASSGATGSEDDGLDGLFGMTEHRPVSLAGVDEGSSTGDEPSGTGLISGVPGRAGGAERADDPSGSRGQEDPMAPETGDHDGMTISLAQLRAEQQANEGAAGASGEAMEEPPSEIESVGRAELVHAVRCPAGHLNPPLAASCRVCGVEVPSQDHESVPRPVLGVLRFSDGTDRPLSRSMLLGRSPKAAGSLTGEQLPELVTLDSPSRELSGTHLEIRLEGWQVLVIDRRSTNGTTVQLPGRDPQRLHPGNAVPIVPGTIIDLAEEVQFTYEVAS